MWYQFFKVTIFRPLVRFGFRAELVGGENMPSTGPVLLASNHVATMDSVVIPAMLQRRMTFPAKADLFIGNKGIGSKIVAWFLKAIGMVPMDRSGGRASATSLQAISDVLQAGHVIGIYPEGTRSPDGRLYKGKTGAARMALAYQVPVLPVGVMRTKKVTGWFGIPWLWRPKVILGEPLDFSQLAGRTDAQTLRWVTDEIVAAIQQLTGQEYADVYAVRVKSGDLKEIGSDEFVRQRPGGGPPPLRG